MFPADWSRSPACIDGSSDSSPPQTPSPQRRDRARTHSIQRVRAHDTLPDAYLPRDLPVAFPVGLLVRDDRVIHRRLDIALGVDRPRSDAVFSRRGLVPIQRPLLPGKGRMLLPVDSRPLPPAVIEAVRPRAARVTASMLAGGPPDDCEGWRPSGRAQQPAGTRRWRAWYGLCLRRAGPGSPRRR